MKTLLKKAQTKEEEEKIHEDFKGKIGDKKVTKDPEEKPVRAKPDPNRPKAPKKKPAAKKEKP